MIHLRRKQSEQIERADPVRFRFDGKTVEGRPGDSVAVALWQLGQLKLRAAPMDGAPRGMFCCMALCQECAVVVDGKVVEACRLKVEIGLEVSSLDYKVS